MFWDNGEWSMASSGIADQILPIPGQWNDAGGAYGPMYGGNISKQAFAWPFHTGPETKILLGTQTTDGNKTNADGLRKWSQNRKMADIRITKGRHPYLSDQYEKPSDRVGKTFTPPTAPLKADKGTVALFSVNNSYADSSYDENGTVKVNYTKNRGSLVQTLTGPKIGPYQSRHHIPNRRTPLLSLTNNTAGAGDSSDTYIKVSTPSHPTSDAYFGVRTTNTGSLFSITGDNATDSNNEKLNINLATGQVGINQDAPLARLDIKGNTTTFDGMSKIYLTDANSNAASRNCLLYTSPSPRDS